MENMKSIHTTTEPHDIAAIDRMRRAQNDYESTINDLGNASGGATRLSGQFAIKGSGEKRVEIVFPAQFTEKPFMTFGGEIETDFMIDGQFPTISLVVSRWITKDLPPYSRLFVGCEFAVVTTGPSVQKMIVTWAMDGPTVNLLGAYSAY
jgi:hypothetical protein